MSSTSQLMKSDQKPNSRSRTLVIQKIQKNIRALKPCRLLKELVSIASSSGDEYAAARYLEHYLTRQQIKVRRQHVEPNRFNLVASIGRRGRRDPRWVWPKVVSESQITACRSLIVRGSAPLSANRSGSRLSHPLESTVPSFNRSVTSLT